jgi:hypothetical protein
MNTPKTDAETETETTTKAMTCEDVQAMARDLSRGADAGGGGGDRASARSADAGRIRTDDPALDPELLRRGRGHLRGCPACGQRMADEGRLDARLAQLAAGEEAPLPPALEQQVLRAFRGRFAQRTPLPSGAYRPSAPPRARRGPRLLLGGLALAGAAAAGLLLLGPPRETPVARQQPAVPLPALVDERAALPIVGADDPALAAGAGDDLVVIARPGLVRAGGGAFVPLGWEGDARPIEIGRVARVRLPTALAARFGWPLLPDAPDARVSADVLVGEDGTARALRFLPATYTPVVFSKEESR